MSYHAGRKRFFLCGQTFLGWIWHKSFHCRSLFYVASLLGHLKLVFYNYLKLIAHRFDSSMLEQPLKLFLVKVGDSYRPGQVGLEHTFHTSPCFYVVYSSIFVISLKINSNFPHIFLYKQNILSFKHLFKLTLIETGQWMRYKSTYSNLSLLKDCFRACSTSASAWQSFHNWKYKHKYEKQDQEDIKNQGQSDRCYQAKVNGTNENRPRSILVGKHMRNNMYLPTYLS